MQNRAQVLSMLQDAQRVESGAIGCVVPAPEPQLQSVPRPVALLLPARLAPAAQLSLIEQVLSRGRPLIVKPAPGGAISATVLFDALHALALPPGMVALLQGDGPGTGALIASHPDIETLRIRA